MVLIVLVLILLSGASSGQSTDTRTAALLRASQLRSAGQHQAVVDLLTPWVRDHPDDDEAHMRLGQAHVDLDQPERGMEIWRHAVDREPRTPRKYRSVSQRCRLAGMLQEALEVLVEGGRVLGDPHQFSWEVAQTRMELGNHADAAAGLLDYLRVKPQHLGVVEGRLMAVVRAETSTGSAGNGERTSGLVNALQGAADAARPRGDHLHATALLASLLLESGDPGGGLRALEGIAQLPSAGTVLFQYASRCEAMGHDAVGARAYALYSSLDTESPHRYEALLRRARLEERQGQYERASALYRQVIDDFPARPEAAEALFRTGRLQLEVEGDPAAARQSLEAAVSGDRSGALRWAVPRLLAECDLQQDDLAAASRRLHHVLTGPAEGAPSARFGLAELCWFGGDLETAVAHLDCLLAQHPGHHLANDALSLLLAIDDHGHHGEALLALAQAGLRHRQGRMAEAEASWAWLDTHAPPGIRELALVTRARLVEAAEPDRALGLYERLRAEFPDGRHAIAAELGRARFLERGGRLDPALKAYEATLLQWPDDPQAPQIRLEIQRLRSLLRTPKAG